MAEMTTAQLTEYLKQVSTLEVSVYKQEKTRAEAYKELKPINVKPQKINQPVNRAESLKEPTAPTTMGKYEILLSVGLVLLTVCIACALWAYVINENVSGLIVWIIIGISAMVMFVIGLVSKMRQSRINEEEFERIKQKYRNRRESYEAEYKAALRKYDQRVAEAEEAFNHAKLIAKQNYDQAKKVVTLLDAPLNEAKEILIKLYGADVIFPKYRNMVAMCTMYEYFASGRCTELVGANGAYNLYEAESRQNVIINQLERVNTNLEQVKQNQYVLYQGIVETNQALREISSEVKSVVNATQDIAVSSRITSYCAQVAAVNAQVQTYLAVMD